MFDQRHPSRAAGDVQMQGARTPGRTTLVEGTYGDAPLGGPRDTAATTTQDPEFTVLSNGFDPMIPAERLTASGGDVAKVVAYLGDVVARFYAQPAQKAAPSPARVRQETAGARFQAMHAEEQAAGHAAALDAAARRWNASVRGAAIQRVVGDYRAIPVTLPGKVPITFRAPYNINIAGSSEAGGFNTGKGTPKEIGQAAQAAINQRAIDKYLPPRGENQTVEQQIRQLSQTEAGRQQLSEAVTHMCRMRLIGVDCSGFVFQVVDQADRWLGGDGWPTDQVNRWSFGSDTMTGDLWSTPISLAQVAAGDVLRFDPEGHHVAIVQSAQLRGDIMTLGIAHSNETQFLDSEKDKPNEPPNGVFVGTADIPLALDGKLAEIGEKLKAIPVIMGESSTFAGFRRLVARAGKPDTKKLGAEKFT